MPSQVKVGVVIAPHGVRGQVKIRCLTGHPDILFKTPLTDLSGERLFALIRQGIQKNLFIASIDGIQDRSAAEKLKGQALYAPASALPPCQENEWHYGELMGLEARLPSGGLYGTVKDVYNFGAGDIIEIALPGGKQEMLPFKNSFVGEIKPGEGYITVFPPEYMEDKE